MLRRTAAARTRYLNISKSVFESNENAAAQAKPLHDT